MKRSLFAAAFAAVFAVAAQASDFHVHSHNHSVAAERGIAHVHGGLSGGSVVFVDTPGLHAHSHRHATDIECREPYLHRASGRMQVKCLRVEPEPVAHTHD